MASSQNTMIVTATAAALAAGVLGYVVYFDHQRRKNPEFRKHLRRNERKQARQAKEAAEFETQKQRLSIKQAVTEAGEEGFPASVEEKEAFFLEQVSTGETLTADPSRSIDAALAFYKALKVYPTPNDLIGIYDKTVPKPILDILAEMIAYDQDLKIEAFAPSQRSAGIPGMGGMPDMPTVGLD
ncbi:hypothetical protein NKR23_g4489 [Pleurostoma richardsiae]|uniref:Mitochondrial import receptor subunit TOM20 n=1 Tax=Pleurostoma richardsiae TaxID=41990 RepID=A0AA38S1E4_9PEZI|nr:hypothetical protein NKR23_g4489 [Pleurostoma richardsiae]